jgi:hypothetical protein
MQIFHSTLMVYNVYKGDQPILKFILMMLWVKFKRNLPDSD